MANDFRLDRYLARVGYHEAVTPDLTTLAAIHAAHVNAIPFEGFDPPQCAPFENHEDLYATIDSSTLGDIPWQCLVTQIPDDINEQSPNWMRTHYEVWYRDPDAVVSAMLSNPDFDGQFDLCPYIDLDTHGKRRWNNVMSGNIAWRRSVSISVFLLIEK